MSLLTKNKPASASLAPATPRVRSLADADPNYATALALVRNLQGKKSALDTEETDLLFRIANENQDGPKAQSAKVAALLGDEHDDTLPVSGPRARLTQIMGERRDLTAAMDIANARLLQARYAASRTICDEVEAEYTARVQAVAASLQSFVAAHAVLVAVTNELESKDIAWVGQLRPLRVDSLVDRADRWLAEAREYGFIEKDKK